MYAVAAILIIIVQICFTVTWYLAGINCKHTHIITDNSYGMLIMLIAIGME